jgi:hypothetical protein
VIDSPQKPDRGFRALKTLSAYAAEAKANRRVMA